MPVLQANSLIRADLAGSIKELDAQAVENRLVGLEIAPIWRADKEKSDLPVLQREDYLRIPEVLRGAKGDYSRSEYEIGKVSYDTVERGHEFRLGDDARKRFQNNFNADMHAADLARLKLLLDLENRIATALTDTAVFTPVSVGTEWDTVASATPMADLATQAETFENQTGGLLPNTLVISSQTHRDLSLNAEIRDWIKYTHREVGAGLLSLELLAAALQLERVVVMSARQTTSDPGAATSVFGRLWSSEYAMLCFVDPGVAEADGVVPTIMRTVLWVEDAPDAVVVEQYREDTTRSDIFRARNSTQAKIVDAVLGLLLDNIHT